MKELSPIKKYLSTLRGEEKNICEKLHELVSQLTPGSFQMIYHGFPGYSTSKSGFDRIIYIAPQSNWVNLGFFFGGDIPDPKKLLTGTGKRMRHIKIRTEKEVDDPAIKNIVKKAWEKAPRDIASIHTKKKKV